MEKLRVLHIRDRWENNPNTALQTKNTTLLILGTVQKLKSVR